MKTFEVKYEGELIGHYEADDAEDAKLMAMDDTDIPAFELDAVEI